MALVALSALISGGCRDVSRFSTAPGQSYCGDIIKGTFIRNGFGPAVRLRLTFDADHTDSAPGTISTSDGMFQNTAMRPIPQLLNDPLWTLDFGEGRDRNLIYVVDPADAGDGPSVFIIVSLLHNGDAEARLLRGAPNLDGSPAGAANGRPLFGVFAPMQRQTDACGF